MLRSLVPPDRTVLPSLILFSHKILPDLHHMYEARCRWVTNGQGMIQGIDYDESYSPVARPDSIKTCCCIAASIGMMIFGLDVVNAFQTRYEPHPSKRQYITVPPGYLSWFRA